MFQYGIVAGGLQIKHQHEDGSWAEMEPHDAHDAARFDEERDWQRGHVYVCSQCQQAIAVSPPAGGDASEGHDSTPEAG